MEYEEAVKYLKSLGKERAGQINLKFWNLSESSEYEAWVRIRYTNAECEEIRRRVEERDGRVFQGGQSHVSFARCKDVEKNSKTPEIAVQKAINWLKDFLSIPTSEHHLSVLSPRIYHAQKELPNGYFDTHSAEYWQKFTDSGVCKIIRNGLDDAKGHQ